MSMASILGGAEIVIYPDIKEGPLDPKLTYDNERREHKSFSWIIGFNPVSLRLKFKSLPS